ncbi:MAG: hypothetical protein OEW75_04995, partial [Cyclobacteriaceae bacterium]|nr:hypothetical protein [Cyclobacteriaceae bacterium]
NTTNTNNTNTSNSTNVNNTTNTAVNTSSNTNVNNTTNTGNTESNTNTATNSTNNNTTTGTVSTSNTGTTGTTGTNTNTTNSTKAGKYTVSVCHAVNNTNQIININENALSAHLGHGDKLYDCNSSSNMKVRICHNAGSNKTQTIEVSTSALKAHLDHGDVLGGCDGTGYKVEAAKSNNSEDKKENPKKGNGNSGNGNDESHLLASSEVSSAMYASLFGYNEIKADTNINVYSTVKAKVFIFEKTVKSFGTLDMKILDAKTGSLISTEKFNGEYIWKSQWGYFNGDERALTDEQKTIVGQREAQPPNDQDMFILFTQPIFDQLMNKMKRFYN